MGKTTNLNWLARFLPSTVCWWFAIDFLEETSPPEASVPIVPDHNFGLRKRCFRLKLGGEQNAGVHRPPKKRWHTGLANKIDCDPKDLLFKDPWQLSFGRVVWHFGTSRHFFLGSNIEMGTFERKTRQRFSGDNMFSRKFRVHLGRCFLDPLTALSGITHEGWWWIPDIYVFLGARGEFPWSLWIFFHDVVLKNTWVGNFIFIGKNWEKSQRWRKKTMTRQL